MDKIAAKPEEPKTRTWFEFAEDFVRNPWVQGGAQVVVAAAAIAGEGKLASAAERFLPKASTLLGAAEKEEPALAGLAKTLPEFNTEPTADAVESLRERGQSLEKVQARLLYHQQAIETLPGSEVAFHQYVGRASAHLKLGHADLALRDVDVNISKLQSIGVSVDPATYQLRARINADLGNAAAAESDKLLANKLYKSITVGETAAERRACHSDSCFSLPFTLTWCLKTRRFWNQPPRLI